MNMVSLKKDHRYRLTDGARTSEFLPAFDCVVTVPTLCQVEEVDGPREGTYRVRCFTGVVYDAVVERYTHGAWVRVAGVVRLAIEALEHPHDRPVRMTLTVDTTFELQAGEVRVECDRCGKRDP